EGGEQEHEREQQQPAAPDGGGFAVGDRPRRRGQGGGVGRRHGGSVRWRGWSVHYCRAAGPRVPQSLHPGLYCCHPLRRVPEPLGGGRNKAPGGVLGTRGARRGTRFWNPNLIGPVMPPDPPPLLTPDLPGVGGRIKAQPEDFEVEEIPAYEP